MILRRLLLCCAVALSPPALADDAPEQLVDPTSLSQRLMQLNDATPWSQSCCKTCRKGQACGDSCISRSKTCSAGKGCACQG